MNIALICIYLTQVAYHVVYIVVHTNSPAQTALFLSYYRVRGPFNKKTIKQASNTQIVCIENGVFKYFYVLQLCIENGVKKYIHLTTYQSFFFFLHRSQSDE